MNEQVILVNNDDEVVGYEDKLIAHEKGLLHRAISVLIFGEKGWLLQQRASEKYHCGNLWTNTCCTHPRKAEDNLSSAKRRLWEEMGITNVKLHYAFSFIYKTTFNNDLTEHELDHVFIGYSNNTPQVNLSEVKDYKWIQNNILAEEIQVSPNLFTPWFKAIAIKFFLL